MNLSGRSIPSTWSQAALHEIEPVVEMCTKLAMIGKITADGKGFETADIPITEAPDVPVKWFCIPLNDQSTSDEFHGNYPADRVVSDPAPAIFTVRDQARKMPDEFPTTPAAMGKLGRKKINS